MRKCVNLDGKVYKSNGSVEGKDYLYSTQGEQIYQSSLKANVQLQVCGALNCKDVIFEPDDKLELTMMRVPQFEIGASVDSEETPKTGTQNIRSFCVPTSNKIDARIKAKRLSNLTEALRLMLNDQAELCLLKHPKTGEVLDMGKIRDLKQKVSSYNQEIKKSVIGQLQEAGLTQGTAEWIQHYGANMGRNRKQIAAYSVRVIVNINHNIYNEYSIANLTDKPESYDYKISKRKRYSIERRFIVDVPIQTLEQLYAIRGVVDNWNANLGDIIKELIDTDIVDLGTLSDRSKEQIDMDNSLAESFNRVDLNAGAENIVEIDSAEENESLLDELFARSSNLKPTASRPVRRRGQVQVSHKRRE